MVREQLMENLRKLGMEFPETATVSQLREMLRKVVGASGPENQNSEGEVELQAQANVQDEIDVHTHTEANAATSKQVQADIHSIIVEQERRGEATKNVREQTSQQSDAMNVRERTNQQADEINVREQTSQQSDAMNVRERTNQQADEINVREQTSQQSDAMNVRERTNQQADEINVREHTSKQTVAMNMGEHTNEPAVAMNVREHVDKQAKDVQANNILAEIDKQLRKLKLLKLQYEMNEVEEKKENTKGVNFVDVEGAIAKFTGDDEQNVVKWTREFERITTVLGCGATEKFLYARRMMAGSAGLFMRSSEAKTWQDFKQELEIEFKRSMGIKETLKTLENRKWNRQAESLHRYTLVMQELAEGAPVTEAELIEYIVEGVKDRSLATTMSLNHTTLASFKSCIPKYEKMLRERSQQRVTNAMRPKSAEVRCYKCQQFGHYATTCTMEYKPKGACFKCGKLGHFKEKCPKQTVAAVDEEEKEEEIDWRMKPVQLHQ
ncbi:uncharacterized protein [Musca autumnalis]|uniref:uncharacterized protein n=1 Tax=Musca autumnalis TaxID=221902 RepID=UPI003CEA7779